jgi:hypothetical protein
MDSRRTFLPPPAVRTGDGARWSSRTDGMVRLSGAFGRSEAADALPRKAGAASAAGGPYRKPTQVVGKNILRCSSESRLRNSAN